jgi:hypothetical protein
VKLGVRPKKANLGKSSDPSPSTKKRDEETKGVSSPAISSSILIPQSPSRIEDATNSSFE